MPRPEAELGAAHHPALFAETRNRHDAAQTGAVIDDVEVRAAGSKGLGVFARRSFEPGEFLFRRRHGQIVDAAGIESLSDEDRMHLCELGFDRYAVLLPPGCYLNHSCEPVAMRHGVIVFAYRPIAVGTSTCTGVVACSFFALDPATQAEYLPHAPAFIRREWRRRRSTGPALRR